MTGDVLLNGGLIASGRSHVLTEARAAETPTNDLPIGYIGALFGTEAQVTSIAWCFDNPPFTYLKTSIISFLFFILMIDTYYNY